MKPLSTLGLTRSLALFALLAASACDSGTMDNGDPRPNGAAAQTSSAGSGPAAGGGGSIGSGGGSTGVGGAQTGGSTNIAGSNAGGASAGTGSGGAPGTPCTDTPPNNGDTCAHAVQYGWCGQSWLGDSCQESCGKCTGGAGGSTSGGSTSSGGTSSGGATQGGGGQPPMIVNGTSGWATRYWDCCKPACGWTGNVPMGSQPVASCNSSDQSYGTDFAEQSSCQSGSAYMCGNFGPWAVSDTLAYGFAAVSQGSDYCGRCYQSQFTGMSHNSSNDAGSQSLSGKTMIVQAINNGGVDGTQFDLLIPGGGVEDFPNACPTEWGTSDLGVNYGGFFLACQQQNNYDYASSKACAAAKCQTVFAGKPDFLAGCNWFVNWFGAPDNPSLTYQEVTCPAAITSLSGLKRP